MFVTASYGSPLAPVDSCWAASLPARACVPVDRHIIMLKQLHLKRGRLANLALSVADFRLSVARLTFSVADLTMSVARVATDKIVTLIRQTP